MAKPNLQQDYLDLAQKCTDLRRSVSKDEQSVITRGGIPTSDAGRGLKEAMASKLKVTLAINEQTLEDAKTEQVPEDVPKKKGRK